MSPRLALDPPKSAAQRRLMEGVAHNPDFAAKVGIPVSVGKEFVGDARVQAAGTLFVTPEGRILLVKRSAKGDHAGEWSLPGGHVEQNETPLDAAKREAMEELAIPHYPDDPRFFSRTLSGEGVDFSTFVCRVPGEFEPTLEKEHTAHGWFPAEDLPANLHPGLRASLGPLVAGDMKPDDWRGLVEGFLKFIREEEREPEHANDAALALDLATTRTYTVEGHLHVSRTPISKANVCEYFGREIPGSEALGLEPDRKYRLLRDPEELKKAAETSNGKPLLIVHEASEADAHPRELTVGSLGTDAEFEDPYVYNSLSVWDGDAIRGIEDKSRRQLSAGYRYRADMAPGVFRGAPFDGVMRDIIFNHEALVPAGRAGSDVLVGDSAIQDNGEIIMTKQVLSRKALYMASGVAALLGPRLAKDAKFDPFAAFEGVSAANWNQKKPTVLSRLRSVPLAKDQTIDPVIMALDTMEKEEVPEGEDANPSSGLPMSAAEMKKKAEDDLEELKKKEAKDRKARDKKARDARKAARDALFERAKEGKDEKTCAAIDELMGELDGMDAESERASENEEGDEGGGGKDKRGGKDKWPDNDRRAHDQAITPQALDAALKASGDAIRKQYREAAEAREFVEPYVGKIGLALDSAADIYRLALDELKVDVADVPKDPATYRAILKAQPKPGDAARQLAQDALPDVSASGTSSRFGGLVDRIAMS